MRQLCNATYAMMTEYLDSKELDKFDRELKAPPGKRASTGTAQLMAAFGMNKGPRR